jgi:hypothetical protein
MFNLGHNHNQNGSTTVSLVERKGAPNLHVAYLHLVVVLHVGTHGLEQVYCQESGILPLAHIAEVVYYLPKGTHNLLVTYLHLVVLLHIAHVLEQACCQ